MNQLALQQRCWNHEAREAVCRCPQCGRSFCRECVTEHESRLLCATCLRNIALAAAARRGKFRRLAALGLTLAGVMLAWAIFFGAGESLITITERSERMAWQDR
ncbi:MAG: rhomboid family protein [Bryobacteraceae bacterium]